MAIEGRIEAVALADICQLLAMGRKTGCLSVKDKSNFGYVFFEEGRVIFATVLNRPDRLGEVLVRGGVITKEDLAGAMEEHLRSPNRRLGQVLVSQEKLTSEELQRFVSAQIQEAVYHLFAWESGSFSFEPGRLPDEDESLLVSLNTEGLLLEGARRVDEWSQIEKRVPSTDLVFRVEKKPGKKGKKGDTVELTSEQEAVLPLLDGTRTVDDVVLDSGLVEFEVAKAVYGLIQAGYVGSEGERREADEEGEGEEGPEAGRALALADAFYKSGMLEDAESHYRRVLDTDAGNVAALGRLAVIALRTGQPAQALEHLDALPDPANASVATLRNRALALELLGRSEEALESLEEAVKADPDDLDVMLSRGRLLLKTGKTADAVDGLRRYRERAMATEGPAAMYFAYGILAAAASGDDGEAIRIGREGLGLYPANCPILVNLGAVLERVGETEAAEALFLRAVQRRPPPPQAHKNLGDLAHRRGDQAGARAHYERAVKIDPSLGDDTYAKLGELAYNDGDSDQARELWLRALELNPENGVVRTNLAMVSKSGDS